jgi:hypothetical protein
MASTLQWFVGNKDPSIAEILTIGGVVKDLTGCTVKFRMRAVGSSTLKVDAAATVVSAGAGSVRYDWQTADVDTAATYLVWWTVTTVASGNTQDMGEAVIQFLAHADASTFTDYVGLEEFKTTLTIANQTFADPDVVVAIGAASRAIEQATGRFFWKDVNANQVRYYSPTEYRYMSTDDLAIITSVKTDNDGDGTFENTWTLNTDYAASPLNAPSDSEPYTRLDVKFNGRYLFQPLYPRTLQITGQFGWPAVPPPIKQATTILAHRLLRRAREVPFGVSGIGLDGSVVRIMAQDPDVEALIMPYSRTLLVA